MRLLRCLSELKREAARRAGSFTIQGEPVRDRERLI